MRCRGKGRREREKYETNSTSKRQTTYHKTNVKKTITKELQPVYLPSLPYTHMWVSVCVWVSVPEKPGALFFIHLLHTHWECWTVELRVLNNSRCCRCRCFHVVFCILFAMCMIAFTYVTLVNGFHFIVLSLVLLLLLLLLCHTRAERLLLSA